MPPLPRGSAIHRDGAPCLPDLPGGDGQTGPDARPRRQWDARPTAATSGPPGGVRRPAKAGGRSPCSYAENAAQRPGGGPLTPGLCGGCQCWPCPPLSSFSPILSVDCLLANVYGSRGVIIYAATGTNRGWGVRRCGEGPEQMGKRGLGHPGPRCCPATRFILIFLTNYFFHIVLGRQWGLRFHRLTVRRSDCYL